MMREGGEGAEDVKPLRITDRRMLSWFYRALGPYWWQVLIGTVATLASSGAQLAIPRPGRTIIDQIIIGHHFEILHHYLLLLLGLLAAQQVAGALRMNVMHILGQRFVFNLRRECYQHLQGLSLAYYDDHPTGDIMSRLSNDVSAVEDMVVHGTDNIISNVFHIALTAGQTLTVALVGPSGSQFNIYLYAPGTASVKDPDTPYLAAAAGSSANDRFTVALETTHESSGKAFQTDHFFNRNAAEIARRETDCQLSGTRGIERQTI